MQDHKIALVAILVVGLLVRLYVAEALDGEATLSGSGSARDCPCSHCHE